MNLVIPGVLIWLGLALVSANKIAVHDCGSKLAKITSIDVQPCTAIPCPFKKGTTVDVTVEFQASENFIVDSFVACDAGSFTKAESKVHGIIAGIAVPFPLRDKDACNNMKCPIKSGDKAVYKNSVAVLKNYPGIGVMVKWEIVSGKDTVLCFTVPVKIVS
ncbi:epididymal secretory protein E1-like [Elysia marginata]|uniref:Epididymal secretory protein E1-like n=1 Tax=Elysia marginata TaxID=1093978 RepID=A0AAV4F749_9GAST|nr:epididymal secretory protein E1-like [Elysia marginata]